MSFAGFDTLILSDLHLGSELSRARDARNLLENISFKRLILLGDIFSDLNFRRLNKDHWKFLGCIRKLSNPKRGVEVVWVEGNHDRGLIDVMSHLVGVPAYEEYSWTFRGLRHLAIHGHQFDRFVLNNVFFSTLVSAVHLQMQKLDFKQKWFSRSVDQFNTRWLRLSEKVRSGAIAHARLHNADRIFCGHTHVATKHEHDGIAYYNTGAWTDSRPTYITVDTEGVRIHEYERRADDSDSGEERSHDDSAFADFVDPAGLSEDLAYEDTGR
ncbi:MAG TPA: UDP-2,3-diacylglucosamine diphosphatase [Terriglobales bacterium]|jgi:UDP-2,3-diacylglucosamine pyrophosphatase LpxH